MTVYAEVSKGARKVVRHYQSDLQIDRAEIARWPDVPFLHIARDCGTYIFMMHTPDSGYWPAAGTVVPYLFGKANREHIARDTLNAVLYCAHEHATDGSLWRYYDGRVMRTITVPAAVLLARLWLTGVIKAWG